jgi:general secretion pathway protein K
VRTPAANDRGVALLVTLLVTILIVTVVFEIFRVGTRAARAGAYGRDSVRATLLAEAGTAVARLALREDAKEDAKNSGGGIDTLDEFWSRPAPPIEMGDGTINVTVEDEERKINLNKLMRDLGNDEDKDRVADFRRLLEVLGLDQAIADAILDWLDRDDNTRPGGAESSYYLSLPYPYKAKNDLFDTIEELRLVRGVTGEVFEKIKPFVTVRSSGLVNINTAPREVLMSLSGAKDAGVSGDIDEGVANEIIEHRKENPFLSTADVKFTPFLTSLYNQGQGFRSLITVRSQYFHVRSAGDLFGTTRAVDAVGIRSGNDIQWRYWRLE